jgi:hypothetical protein
MRSAGASPLARPEVSRRRATRLLTFALATGTTTWTDAIDEAAAARHWTHVVIRKDDVHPVPISLERVLENDSYAVFRFQ